MPEKETINPRNPEKWLDAFLENVPGENRESFGQVHALREYRDAIAPFSDREQEQLWQDFQKALDERFPSRKVPVPTIADPPLAAPEKVSDEQILEEVLPVFAAPGDQSREFHELLFRRAMGQVEQRLADEGFLSRYRRRRRMTKRIREWMRVNLE